MKTKKIHRVRRRSRKHLKKHLKKVLFDAAKVHPASLILSTNRGDNR